MSIKNECLLLKGLPANKKGWRWVWATPRGRSIVNYGNWYCIDYNTQCEICKDREKQPQPLNTTSAIIPT